MTVNQFLKFVTMLGYKNITIKYFKYEDMGNKFLHDIAFDDVGFEWIVCAYLILLEDNEVHVFVRAI